MRLVAGILGLAGLLTAACVDKHSGPPAKQIDPAYVQANLLRDVPSTMVNKIGADLGGKVVYLGNDFDGAPLVPGQKVTIKHYWKVVAPPGDDWRVFSHVRGEGAHPDFLNVDSTDMRTGHPPSDWKPGEIIQDEQVFTLSANWHSPTATLIVGLYPKGKFQVSDRMPVKSGPSLDSAVIAARYTVDLGKAAASPGKVTLRHAAGAITVDGKDGDPGWRGALSSGEFAIAEGSPDPSGKTVARMTWDERALYLFVSCDDTDVASQYKNQDDPLWKEDTVEIFIDADGNHRGYVELQVNPNNAHFDTWWPGTRGEPDDKTYDSHLESAVAVHGTLDNRDDTDTGWDAEIAIPWDAVKGKDAAMAVRLPPQPGDTWRLNVVRVDKGKDPSIAAASWNPITYQDFHALDRMLTVVFADASGNTKPPAPAPVGPTLDGGAPAPAPDGGAAADGGTRSPGSPAGREEGPHGPVLAPAKRPAPRVLPAPAPTPPPPPAP